MPFCVTVLEGGGVVVLRGEGISVVLLLLDGDVIPVGWDRIG